MRETWKIGIVAVTLAGLLAPSFALAADKGPDRQGAANAQVEQKAQLMKERRELRKQMNGKRDPATAQKFAANRAKLRTLAKSQKGGK